MCGQSTPDGAISRIAVSSACGLNSHVRISTLLSIPQALSLHFIEISPSGPSGVIWRTTLSAPLSWMLTYVCVRSASRQGLFLVLHPNGGVQRTKMSGAELCQHPLFGSLRTTKYAPTSQSALNCKKATRKSGFPFARARLLLFPTKRTRLLRRFVGDPDSRGAFAFCIQMAAFSELSAGVSVREQKERCPAEVSAGK